MKIKENYGENMVGKRMVVAEAFIAPIKLGFGCRHWSNFFRMCNEGTAQRGPLDLVMRLGSTYYRRKFIRWNFALTSTLAIERLLHQLYIFAFYKSLFHFLSSREEQIAELRKAVEVKVRQPRSP